MSTLAIQIVFRRRTRRIRVAQILGPVELIVHSTGVIQDLASVCGPEHHCRSIAAMKERRPGTEDLLRGAPDSPFGRLRKRLKADLESHPSNCTVLCYPRCTRSSFLRLRLRARVSQRSHGDA